MDNVLVIRGLVNRYGDTVAPDGVDLTVAGSGDWPVTWPCVARPPPRWRSC
jgi:hypothetical protein